MFRICAGGFGLKDSLRLTLSRNPLRMEPNPMLRPNSFYFSLREKLRFNRVLSQAIYSTQSLVHANFGSFRRQVFLAGRRVEQPRGVALCCGIRDEARYLGEWIEYYSAAGIEHFFSTKSLPKTTIDRFLSLTWTEGWRHCSTTGRKSSCPRRPSRIVFFRASDVSSE